MLRYDWLKFTAIVFLTTLHAQGFSTPHLLDYQRTKSGQINVRLAQYGAPYDCADRNTHLPSALEWAQFAMDQGAKGIRDYSLGPAKSYQLISVRNADGSTDQFYYSNEGYQAPVDKAGDDPTYLLAHMTWTASVSVRDWAIGVMFNSTTGKFEVNAERWYGFAIRCAAGSRIISQQLFPIEDRNIGPGAGL